MKKIIFEGWQVHPLTCMYLRHCCIYNHSLTFLNIRRIAKIEEEKCKIVIQDIMYLLIIFKFYAFDVSLVPRFQNAYAMESLSFHIWKESKSIFKAGNFGIP